MDHEAYYSYWLGSLRDTAELAARRKARLFTHCENDEAFRSVRAAAVQMGWVDEVEEIINLYLAESNL